MFLLNITFPLFGTALIITDIPTIIDANDHKVSAQAERTIVVTGCLQQWYCSMFNINSSKFRFTVTMTLHKLRVIILQLYF